VDVTKETEGAGLSFARYDCRRYGDGRLSRDSKTMELSIVLADQGRRCDGLRHQRAVVESTGGASPKWDQHNITAA
jgi:hypothetical protein